MWISCVHKLDTSSGLIIALWKGLFTSTCIYFNISFFFLHICDILIFLWPVEVFYGSSHYLNKTTSFIYICFILFKCHDLLFYHFYSLVVVKHLCLQIQISKDNKTFLVYLSLINFFHLRLWEMYRSFDDISHICHLAIYSSHTHIFYSSSVAYDIFYTFSAIC